MTSTPASEIRAAPRSQCYLCDRPGSVIYENLPDRLFGTTGTWTLVQCPGPDCGLIWLDPMPLEEDIAKAYRHYYTHSDTARDHASLPLRLFMAAKQGYLARTYGYQDEEPSLGKGLAGQLLYLHPGRRAVIDFNVMWLKPVVQGRLLDVGCGGGEFLGFMQNLGWQVEGVDFDAEAAKNATDKGVHVHVGSLEAQKFAEDTFDAVTMSHFIEHVHHPRQLIEECWRILKPGGRLVMVTPNTGSYGHRLYRDKWMHLDPPRHLHLFNTNTLRRVTESAGFSGVEVFTSIRDAYGMFIGSSSIRRCGSYVMGSRQPLYMRLWARIMEIFEWVVTKFRPQAGEEVVLIAVK